MESLTERVLRSQRSATDRESVIRDIACKVYEYPRHKCRWDEETSSEFFLRVFPKVRGMVERFRDVGRPFESYLASMLAFQVRTFVRERRGRELEWEVAADPELWERPSVDAGSASADEEVPGQPDELRPERPRPGLGWAGEQGGAGSRGAWEEMDPAVRRLFDIGESGRIRSLPARRRFLVASLSCAHLLSDADVAAIAHIVGSDEETLLDAVQRLRSRSAEHSRRLELFTERRNRAFSGLRLADTRLSRETDPQKRGELVRRRMRLKATLLSCHRKISRMRLAPSHQQIADVLAMPKASVDSTIHRLKLRARTLYPPSHEQYA